MYQIVVVDKCKMLLYVTYRFKNDYCYKNTLTFKYETFFLS